jgi:hypothetical protein
MDVRMSRAQDAQERPLDGCSRRRSRPLFPTRFSTAVPDAVLPPPSFDSYRLHPWRRTFPIHGVVLRRAASMPYFHSPPGERVTSPCVATVPRKWREWRSQPEGRRAGARRKEKQPRERPAQSDGPRASGNCSMRCSRRLFRTPFYLPHPWGRTSGIHALACAPKRRAKPKPKAQSPKPKAQSYR